MTELVSLSPEPPVSDMLAALHRNPSASGLLIQAIAARCRHLDQVRVAEESGCVEGSTGVGKEEDKSRNSKHGTYCLMLVRSCGMRCVQY